MQFILYLFLAQESIYSINDLRLVFIFAKHDLMLNLWIYENYNCRIDNTIEFINLLFLYVLKMQWNIETLKLIHTLYYEIYF